MTTVPPGWYDDGHGGMRWWDGSRWTEHVAPPDDAEPPREDAVSGRSPYWGEGPLGEEETPVTRQYVDQVGPVTASVIETEPRRSRPWIGWGVLGAVLVVVVGTVIAANVADTFGGFGIDGAARTDDPPSNESEAAAEAVVRSFVDVLRIGDCDAFFAVTTELYRHGLGVSDCLTLTNHLKRHPHAGASRVDVWAPSIEQEGAGVVIETTEVYVNSRDRDGNETEDSHEYEDRWKYIVVPLDGGWAIDSLEPIS